MNPYELLDVLEERKSEEGLTKQEEALLELVAQVVARVQELEMLEFEESTGASIKTRLKKSKRTEAEMKEYVYLMGPAIFGDLKPTPSHEQLGVVDKNTAIKNARLWTRRIEARKDGWLIEAVALTAYELEEWLRIWIASKGGDEFHPDDNWTLGNIITEAEKYELEPELLKRLREFNKTRKRAIHRLLRGEISYEDLGDAYDLDPELPEDLSRWVVKTLPNFEEALPEWDSIGKWIQWASDRKSSVKIERAEVEAGLRTIAPTLVARKEQEQRLKQSIYKLLSQNTASTKSNDTDA